MARVVSAFGLASVEGAGGAPEFPPEPFSDLVAEAIEAGLDFCPHCGEEFAKTDEGVQRRFEHIGFCVDMKCKRIGHAVALGVSSCYSSQTLEAQRALIAKVKKADVLIECCPHSNMAIASTGVTSALAHVRTLLEAGVDVGLGSDDSICWGMTPGECMRDQARLVAARFGLDVLKTMSKASVTHFGKIDVGREALLKAIGEASEVDAVPLVDIHAHFAASIPCLQEIFDKVTAPGKESGTAQTFVKSPAETQRTMVRDEVCVVGCQNQWADLKAFSQDTYAHQLGIVLSAGISAVLDMLLELAKDGITHKVVGMALNMPLPNGASASWKRLYGAQLLVGSKKMYTMGFVVEYNVALIRNAPVGAGIPVLGAANEINANFQSEQMGDAIVMHWEHLSQTLGSDTVVSPHPAKLPALKTLRDVAMLACACANDSFCDLRKDADLAATIKTFVRGFAAEATSIEKTHALYRFGADQIFLEEGMPVLIAYFTAVERVVDCYAEPLVKMLRSGCEGRWY